MAADVLPAGLPWADVTAELALDPVPSLNGHDEEPHVGPLPQIPAGAAAVGDALFGGLSAALAPLSGIPALQSLAGAAASLYLDFNGHFESSWGSYRNISSPVFDQDGDATTFSESELSTIRNVWAQVAEDYAPFKINVTTVEPASFANGVALRVSIGGDGSWLGDGAGGVAYIDSFTNSVVNTAYVFPKMLANGYFKYVAEATSHEAGHAFGLEHKSVFNASGTNIEEYDPGTAAVAPIMGDSYSSTRGLWSRNYNSDHVMQDDVAIISRSQNGFGFRVDDHGNSAAGATALVVSGSAVSGSGVIHQTTDRDYFSFTTGAGQVNLNVNVVQFNNLDAKLELWDAAGTTLIAAASPSTTFGATISTTLAAGSYRLVVASQGNYGDLGQYTVSGTIVPGTVILAPDAPPGLTATAASATQVNLAWSDVSGEAGYKVERLVGGVWSQIGTTAAGVVTFQDTLAIAGVTYSYRVRAFNDGGDSAYSTAATVTTPTVTPPAVVTKPNAPSSLVATINVNRQVQLLWKDNSTNETVFVVQRSTNGYSWTTLGQVAANSTGALDLTAARSRVYYYRVYAYNSAGYSAASNLARVTTPAFAASTAGTTATKLPTITPFTGKPTATATPAAATSGGTNRAAGQAWAVSSSANSATSTDWHSAVDAVFSSLRSSRTAGRR